MRRLGVFLVVLAVVAVAADFGARWFAQRAVATELAASFELSSEPSVTIGGWPFLVDFLKGRLASVEVETTEPSQTDVALDRITLTLEDVRFDPQRVMRGSIERVRIGGGSGTAGFSDDSLSRALRNRGVEVAVTFAAGEVVVESDGAEVAGNLEVDAGQLLVSSDGGASTAVELPSLGGRAAYRSLDIGDGVATLALEIEPGALRH